MESINIYNDLPHHALDGFGVDISTQRADDLDVELLSLISANKNAPLNILDLGCGKGGQALRMAAHTNCNVTAVDALNLSNDIHQACESLQVPTSRISFIKSDIRNTAKYLHHGYHYIYSQRTMHYLPYNDAFVLLNGLRTHLVKGFNSKLFVSVSGLHSELGNGYADKDKPISEKFALLSQPMMEKHKISSPVCLYTVEELYTLLTVCGYTVEKIYASAFGNVKAIAGM